MRISSIQCNNVHSVKNVQKVNENNLATNTTAPVAFVKQPYFYINFGSKNKYENSDRALFKELDSVLKEEMLEVKDELSIMPIDTSTQVAVNNGSNIDLKKFGLKQRLIVGKYANNSNLKKLLEMPKSSTNNDTIFQNILTKEVELLKKYNSQTYEKFIDTSSSNEEKIKAFSAALFFLAEAMKKSTPAELEKILDTVADFRNSVSSMEMLVDNKCFEKIKKLFDLSKEFWSKYELPLLMNQEFEKMIYTEETTNKYPELQNSKIYTSLPVDEKHFVARYFANQETAVPSDPIFSILSNRTIADVSSVIKEMSNKISIDEDIFYDLLSNSYDYIHSSDGIAKLKDFYLKGRNDNDNISMFELYLLFFQRIDLIDEADETVLLDFFETISDEQLQEANEAIVNEWFQNYLPEKFDSEVLFKAHETDANTRTLKELEQINQNLENLAIKLDGITIPLNQVISNMDRMYVKLENQPSQVQKLQESSSLYISAMKKELSNMTPEQAKKLMSVFQTDGIKYLNTLDAKTSNPQSKAMINNVKQAIYKSNNPMAVVTKLENYAPITILNQGIGTLKREINKSNMKAAVDNLVSQGYEEKKAYALAKNKAALGELPMAALTSAKLGCLTALTAGLYGIYKASGIHDKFSDLYFGE